MNKEEEQYYRDILQKRAEDGPTYTSTGFWKALANNIVEMAKRDYINNPDDICVVCGRTKKECCLDYFGNHSFEDDCDLGGVNIDWFFEGLAKEKPRPKKTYSGGRLTDEEMDDILVCVEEGITYKEIGKKHKVSAKTIWNVLKRYELED